MAEGEKHDDDSRSWSSGADEQGTGAQRNVAEAEAEAAAAVAGGGNRDSII